MITFGIVYTPTLQAPTNSPEGGEGFLAMDNGKMDNGAPHQLPRGGEKDPS